MTISGSGYAPNSTVTLAIYSTPQVLTTVVTDASGNFTATVTVPAGLAAGNHTLVASGVDSSGNVRYVNLAVTVSGSGAATLAYTGADVALPAIGGLAAVALGAGLIVVRRRATRSAA
jgi:titin